MEIIRPIYQASSFWRLEEVMKGEGKAPGACFRWSSMSIMSVWL